MSDAFADTEGRYRLLFESLADAAFVLDQETGRFLDVNLAATRVYGYSHAEFCALRAVDLSCEPELTAKAVAEAPPVTTRRHQRKDGTVFPVEVTLAVVDWDGRKAIVGVARDITEREQAARALAESENRYRAVFSGASDGILLLSPGGEVVDANEAIARMHGLTVSQMLTKRLADLNTPESTATSPERFARLFAGEILSFEVEHFHADGHAFPLEVSASQVSLDGKPYLLAFHRDVTERKKLRAGLAQSERLASMGMLAAGVGHEINNPLAYVLSNVATLAQDLPKLAGLLGRCRDALKSQVGEAAFAQVAGPDAALASPAAVDELVECAQSAHDGARRIKSISRRLGAFSRVDRVALEAVDLSRVLESAAVMSLNELKFRATLVKDLGQVPPVLASEGKLAQVFLNLLLNAAHAIDEGHVAVNRVTLRTWAEAGFVFAEVADTGRGIRRENLERIFEPFFTTKKLGEGSGLGLSISKAIVAEFGGDLRVESEVGKGTRFVVRLPVRPEAQLAAAAAARPAGPVVRGRVLVVDDEEQIRKVLQRTLGLRHAVVTAASGREAQALLENDQAFDLILLDLMMPEVTGMELHAWLTARAPALARKVVFISGGAFTDSAADYLASVGNLRLEKPFERDTLEQVVATFLERKAAP
jgi:PAS domain S-box-containing protein